MREKNPTLLNYDFLDGGFYTVTGIVPECKFFCRLNIVLAEQTQSQMDYIQNGKPDFVITRNSQTEDILSEYMLVSDAFYNIEGKEYVYYLYRHERIKE